MGISTKDNKKVTVTDNDNIEVSNLNRQFLFRKDNVGNSKSKCACQAIKK
jgi:ubiquitin-activating enzyme E1